MDEGKADLPRDLEVKEDQACKVEVSEDKVECEDDAVKTTNNEKQSEEEAAPSPPKRTSQTNQRLKRWSKMIKDSLPSRIMATSGSDKTKSAPDEISKVKVDCTQDDQIPTKLEALKDGEKCVRDRPTEGELAVFLLHERRAVSESRFRMMDKMGSLARTNSMPKMLPDKQWNSGIPPGKLIVIKRKFEAPCGDKNELKAPAMVIKSSSQSKKKIPSDKKSTRSAREDTEQSTTSPESGLEKSDGEKKRNKGDKNKKDKKRKDKRRHSTCSACNSDKESKKEKKRLKKSGIKKDFKKVTIANGQKKEEMPIIPPYPKMMDKDWTNVKRENFFQTLLIKEGEKENIGIQEDKQQVKRRVARSPLRKSTAPTLNVYLKERKVVSDSIFKKYQAGYRDLSGRGIPLGIGARSFFDQRDKFENGSQPLATFPRSVSNLERRSGYSEMHLREAPTPRPSSSMSQGGSDHPVPLRSTSLPRPASVMSSQDHEDYRNYVLELLHSTPRSPRFQQLQAYYNLLDRALRLEKKSASMEVHKLKSDQVVDFEAWRSLRQREKASEELSTLMKDLRAAQKAREFYFRPKEAEDYRWRGDAHLRGRDKSVENLKNHFMRIADCPTTSEKAAKDTYKPLWRAKSVSSVKGKWGDQDRVQEFSGGEGKCSLAGARSRSSLTSQQVSVLKDNLNEIYASNSARSSRSPSRASPGQFEITVPATKLGDLKQQLERQNLFVKPLPDVLSRSPGRGAMHQYPERRIEEEEKKRLSYKIGKEIQERSSPVVKKQLIPREFDLKEATSPLRFTAQPPQKLREISPRTCYSLEHEKAEVKNDECNDFLLVLNHDRGDGSKKKEVEVIVDNWASGGESKAKKSSTPRMSRSRVKHPHKHGKSSDSLSSSGASTGTVILNQKLNRQIRKRSVEELRKSFENLEKESSEEKAQKEVFDLNMPDGQVREIRKSFERIPDSSSPPPQKAPRTFKSNIKKRSLSEEKEPNKKEISLDILEKCASNPDLSGGQKVDAAKYAKSYLAMIRAGEAVDRTNQQDAIFYGKPRAQQFSLPDIDLDYIAQHLTNLEKPLIRAQEIGNVQDTKDRLEEKMKSKEKVKARLKHLYKAASHAKILGKIVSLHNSSSRIMDEGAIKLFQRALAEGEEARVYSAGEVGSKVDHFEKLVDADKKVDLNNPEEPALPTFSWSRRFDASDGAGPARRHARFRSYYGYLPGDVAANMATLDSLSIANDQASGSVDKVALELPPPPPKRCLVQGILEDI